jgi:hypothetical protein
MSARRTVGPLPLAALFAAAACNSLSHQVAGPAPARVALLPFAGTLAPADRDLARELLAFRLRERGYLVQDTAATDRLLSESGWLTDAATFAPAAVPTATACTRLQVDACIVGTSFDRLQSNLVLWRRHALDASLALQRADGSPFWRANGRRTAHGGLVLQSGQLLRELQQQLDHGSPMQTLALLDDLIDAIAATVPSRSAAAAADATAATPPLLATAVPMPPHTTVSVDAPPTATVWLDLPGERAVPMASVGGGFAVTRDTPGAGPASVHARLPFAGAAAALATAPVVRR